MTDIEQIKREVFHAVYDTQITQPSGIFEAIDYLHSRGYLGDIIKKTENVNVSSEQIDAVKVPDGAPLYAEVYVGDGRFAICDWEDWNKVKSFNWRLTTRNGNGTLYAQAWSSHNSLERHRVSMHRIVMGLDGEVIDHINGNGLDNRRHNLRIATRQQNSFNAKSRSGSSKYKGVCYEKSSGLWRSYIRKDSKRYYLGRYSNEIDAAKAYDIKAKEIFGEYANCNF